MSTFFVYGTLTDAARADALLDDWSYGPAARLDGLHRVEGRYPTLAPGGTVSGRLLRTDEVATLDRYEGVASGLYVRASVSRPDADSVCVYVGRPDRLDADAEWPGDGDFRERVAAYLDEHVAVSGSMADGDDGRPTGV